MSDGSFFGFVFLLLAVIGLIVFLHYGFDLRSKPAGQSDAEPNPDASLVSP